MGSVQLDPEPYCPQCTAYCESRVCICKSYCERNVALGKAAWLTGSKPYCTRNKNCAKCDPCIAPPAKCPLAPEAAGMLPIEVLPGMTEYWKLQLPCGHVACNSDYFSITPGKPASVRPHELAKYEVIPRSYTKDGKQFCSGGFYAAKDEASEGAEEDMVVMYVPVSGLTTSGSINPRVEFREMKNGANGGWNVNLGTHKLSMEQKIMHVPANKKSVAFVQIFDGSPDCGEAGRCSAFIEVMTRICSGSDSRGRCRETMTDKETCCTEGELYAMVWLRHKDTGNMDYTMLAPFVEGTRFSLDVTVSNGDIDFSYQAEDRSEPVEYTVECQTRSACGAADSNHVYFKTGAYMQKAPDEAVDDYILLYQYHATI